MKKLISVSLFALVASVPIAGRLAWLHTPVLRDQTGAEVIVVTAILTGVLLFVAAIYFFCEEYE